MQYYIFSLRCCVCVKFLSLVCFVALKPKQDHQSGADYFTFEGDGGGVGEETLLVILGSASIGPQSGSSAVIIQLLRRQCLSSPCLSLQGLYCYVRARQQQCCCARWMQYRRHMRRQHVTISLYSFKKKRFFLLTPIYILISHPVPQCGFRYIC